MAHRQCGNECGNGQECDNGHCVGGIRPSPTEAHDVLDLGESPPWGIDTAGRNCLTRHMFLRSLPQFLGDFERQPNDDAPSSKMVSFATTSTYSAYTVTSAGQDYLVDFAQASEFEEDHTIGEAILAVANEAKNLAGYKLHGQSKPSASFQFILYQQVVTDAPDTAVFLHWGHRTANCLLTVAALDPENAKALTDMIVENMHDDRPSCMED